jgi:hypothetical protein
MSFDITVGDDAQPDTGFSIVMGTSPSSNEGALLEMDITDVTVGNVLLALVVRNANGAFIVQEGWTQVIFNQGASGVFLDGYARAVDGQQGDSVQFFSAVDQELQGALVEIEEADVDTLIEEVEHAAFVADLSAAAPGSTSTQAENLVVRVWSTGSDIDFTAPPDMTSLDTYTSAEVSARTLMVATKLSGDIGTVDSSAATASALCTGRAFTLVLHWEEPPPPAVATLERLRDRLIALITSADPTVLTSLRFRHSQDEGSGDFTLWAEGNPAGAFRRFQVRDSGSTDTFETSMVDLSHFEARMEIRVAYALDKRGGPQGARDRDDVIDADWRLLNRTIGLIGRGNFSGRNNCTPIECSKTIERGEACDFLVVSWRALYIQDMTE